MNLRTHDGWATRSQTAAFRALLFICSMFALGAEAGTAQKIFSVFEYGAVGNGVALDTAAIQRTIDAAAASRTDARVLIPGGHRYLIGTLELRSNIEFHLARGAELILSTNRNDYSSDGVITANNTKNLRITGPGRINGRSLDFMTGYDSKGEWWLFKEWRPKMFLLTGCTNLQVRDLTFVDAPFWGLHMLGCENVLVDHVTIQNRMDVPNCDGIDPDHCRNVEIRNCRITCGDDAIVVKATRQTNNYGPSSHIFVHDCVLQTQDSGLKIGTETTEDIHDIRFERCRILTGSRGMTIQLRDEGSVYDVHFRDITFVSRYYADPWWGRGEAISLTAVQRTNTTHLGSIHGIEFKNIRGVSENSIRVNGTDSSHIRGIVFENVRVTLDRWTHYKGGVFDNRPTKVEQEIELHGTPGFSLRYADQITLRNCAITWGHHVPDYFTYALETERVTDVQIADFKGTAAHPKRDSAIMFR